MNARMAKAPVVPLVQADDPEVAVATTRALAKGGLTVIEVVLRTEAALECLSAICEMDDNLIVGAGTVLSGAQATEVLSRGAKFIVSPGLDETMVGVAQDAGVPVLPGTMTPSEVMKARNLGLDTVKFFPASIAGGIPALKALGSVFGDMKFMPTGGVSAQNLPEFLALKSVLACGGSWLTPAAEIAKGNYDEVTRLAREAVAIAMAAGEK
ncbi:MAG: bifunctional 4-hydroxy-2-oxoglutarate aldolase/2-dehydro-3-deoxy-phosphogluconate aldolase [Gammaproteobacteria bacterium]|nr:bifunctional 4-hydroxy-2-oxoglutarate aldolase/2-dehydro-3-deoxy-phosphogluconate aldolase [Gammaproteobacteria bacterium]